VLLILFFVASVTPLWHFMPPLAISMLLLVLFTNPLKSTVLLVKQRKWEILLFSSLFWVNCIGAYFSENQDDARFDVLQKSSFLLFAVHFASIPDSFLNKKDIKKLLDAFVWVVFATTIFCVIMATVNYYRNADTQFFFYTQLCYFQHPSYLGLSIAFAILLILAKWPPSPKSVFKQNNIYFFFILPWLIVFLFFLQSKAAIISFLLISFLVIIYHCIFLKSLKSGIKIFIYVLITTILSIIFIPNSMNRFYNFQSVMLDNSKVENSKESTAARLELWKAALFTIKQSPVWGYGSGDAYDVYNKHLVEIGFTKEGELGFNAHSQFLQTYMKTGILGITFLICFLFYPLIISFKRKNLIYFGMVTMMIFNLLIESMFERQIGVMFFAIFNSFSYFLPNITADDSIIS
jgi:O-antigen ligase